MSWYSNPLAYDYGQDEPYGNYAKPDLNFMPDQDREDVTALLPGTVTAIDGSTSGNSGYIPAWGHVVTVYLDNPYTDSSGTNARSTAYLHLSNVNVSIGQHVGAGQAVGNYTGTSAGSQSRSVPGFSFGDGNNYGVDGQWAYSSSVGNAPAQWNPTAFIKGIIGNGLPLSTGTGTGKGGTFTPQQCAVGDIQCYINNAIGQLEQNALNTVIDWSERIGIFIVALIILVMGGVLLMTNDMSKAIRAPITLPGQLMKGGKDNGANG